MPPLVVNTVLLGQMVVSDDTTVCVVTGADTEPDMDTVIADVAPLVVESLSVLELASFAELMVDEVGTVVCPSEGLSLVVTLDV